MFKSISTQTGDYSYSTNIFFEGLEPFEVGFSGDSKLFSFSGQSGKIYDNDGNFFYSYDVGETVSVSGNRHPTYNNYFVNEFLFNSNNSQSTGYLESFFVDGSVSADISFDGVSPHFIADSGVLVNNSTTGLFDVFNISESPINFKIYSGNFIGASGNLFSFTHPFDSGNVSPSKSFQIESLLSAGETGTYPVSIELYTNFGLISKNVDILSKFDLDSFFSLGGPSLTTVTGNYDYLLSYDLTFGNDKSTDPYFLNLQLNSISGIGDMTNFTGGTGYYTGTSLEGVDLTGTIINSGFLTGLYTGVITGWNPYLNIPHTGTVSVELASGVYATGDFDFTYSILSTGLASGNIIDEIEAPYDQFTDVYPIGFTGELEEGFHSVTGTGYLSYFTGRSFFNGEWLDVESHYTGITTGEVYSSGTTGQIVETGISGFSTAYPATGLAIHSYTYISTSNDSSGYYDGSPIDCTGANGIGSVLTENSLTGTFYHRVYSNIYGLLSNGFNEAASIQDTGIIYFTGDYKTDFNVGAYLCECTGEGYTGAGVIGVPYGRRPVAEVTQPNQDLGWVYENINATGLKSIDGIFPQFSPHPASTGNAMPLTGIYTPENPLNCWIGGDPLSTGMALVSDYTKETFPILSLSPNDTVRDGYTSNSVALYIKPRWAGTYPTKVKFSVSPRYFASGTGIYQEKQSISAAITMYDTLGGDFNFQEIEYFSWYSSDTWDSKINTFEVFSEIFWEDNPAHFVFNVRDTDAHKVSPSGFYFVNVAHTQTEIPGLFAATGSNWYMGASGYFATTSGSGYGFSQEEARPTGVVNEGFIFNDGLHFNYGGEEHLLTLNVTGSGHLTGDYFVETGTTYLTGTITGSPTSPYYDTSTGHSILDIATGVFDGDTVYLKYIQDFSLEQDPFLRNSKLVKGYTIGGDYSDVESISGDIKNILEPLGFNSYLNGDRLVFSGGSTQYVKFGYSLSSSTSTAGRFSTSFNSYEIDNNTVLVQDEYTTFGSGYQSTDNFSTSENLITSGTGFISGQWIERDDISGYLDVPTSSVYAIVNGAFTGQTLATGALTGLLSATIYDGSGSFQSSSLETGIPSSFGLTPPSTISDAVAISPFTGFLDELFEGSGDYSSVGLFDLVNSGFYMDIPTYIKTFTGEYKFLTGINTGNLIEIPYNDLITGYESGITITGKNSITTRVQKTYYDRGYPDVLQIFYSGENGVTGGLDIL